MKNAPLPAKKKYKKEEKHTSMIMTSSSFLDKDSNYVDGNL
jgi:hypothetical protein